MNSYVQLFLLVFSFIYGKIVFCLNNINIKVFNNKNIIVKIIGNLFYINNMTLIYILVLYKACYGELHVYFILVMLFGYVLECVKKCK